VARNTARRAETRLQGGPVRVRSRSPSPLIVLYRERIATSDGVHFAPSPLMERHEPAGVHATSAGGGHTVTVEGVSRRFGELQAVDDVSLEVPAGEFLSILGPSGCGKTTLLRIIAGLDFAEAGRILIDGRDVTDLPAHKRPTNLVFQRGALFPHKSVFQNVAYPLERQGVRRGELRDRVAQALALVRLDNLGERRPSELSGGQAQRVALARALISNPAVLLLDEPLAALDLALRKEMQLELRRLQVRLGTTFIYVTHDQEEALTMSSRIVIMRHGSIVQIGSPRAIYEHPTSVFASTFIGESNLLLGEVRASADGVALLAIGGHELRAEDDDSLAPGTPVALSIRPERITLAAGENSEEGWNRLPGKVVETIFLGNRVRVQVECAGTAMWIEGPPTDEAAERLQHFASVELIWRIEDGKLIQPDAPAADAPA
jgi:spermidine/putrescine transport system ATP-binding protein